MLKGLVVVESPAKAKTLGTFLGDEYKIIASYGHVRDLLPKSGSVDVNNHYAMVWQTSDKGKKQIAEIKKYLKDTNHLFLATDPDREGEAISWHILDILQDSKTLKNKEINRVVFHEITKNAVLAAFNEPKQLDLDLVKAYMARRVLDYLVGYSLSPVLWKKMPGARSAGRVQSVALRLIVERELEIRLFKAEEYWTIHGTFASEKGNVTAILTHLNGNKLNKLDIKNAEEASKIVESLDKKQYKILSIEKKSIKRTPYAPFITSSLQQDAVRKLGMTAKKVMSVAQKLYEGININGVMVGLITYMRTDSTALSNEAIEGVRCFIKQKYGESYLPKSARIFKTKTKNAQEAHEAIRPTSFDRTPEKIKDFLDADQAKLYELIWMRTVASQMENAKIDQVSIDIASKDNDIFHVSGSTIAFDGFLKEYNIDQEKSDEKQLPNFAENDDVKCDQVEQSQHFTQPPARFNEASLVKKLEELGIGRPSTYATIINVIQDRGYVALQKKTFVPQGVGVVTTSFLRMFFSKYVQYEFTANMEEELDEISNGQKNWEQVLDVFWQDFSQAIEKSQPLSISDVIDAVENDIGSFLFQTDDAKKCPICESGQVHLKFGRYGAFLGCSNYPECRFTKKLESSNSDGASVEVFNTAIEVGHDPELDDTVYLKKGPYGYYFEWGKTRDAKDAKKPKRLGIPKCVNNPEEMTIDDVIAIVALPKQLNNEITLNIGRFGPFIRYNKKTYKITRSDFWNTTLDEALEIIEKQ